MNFGKRAVTDIATNTNTKTKTKSTKSTITKKSAFEQERLNAVKKVKEFKLSCEANVVSALYINHELFYTYDKLKLEDFLNNIWKVYFQIAQDIIVKEKKQSLDEITVGLYLEKHDKLRQKYDEYGGYETLEKAREYVKEENFDGYVKELHKWNAILKMLNNNFPVADKISEFVDMTLDSIYEKYEAMLNHIFVNVDGDVKSYCITDGIYELIDELDQGLAVGLPYSDMPTLTKETSGQLIGSITLVGGLSNVGKTTFARSTVIPSIIKEKEKIVIMLNEDGIKKWQRELMVYVVNNIFKEDIQKYIVRDGKYSKEIKALLKKAADWIKEQAGNHTITIIPFERYQTATAIKTIKKYANMGVKYFMLDTFKPDAGEVSDRTWLQAQQAMVDINDVVKPESKNLHILITFQLTKSSSRQRYYTQENIGVFKNIVDPVSTTIMIRDIFSDELKGGKNELKVYRLEGKNGKTKIPVVLKEDKRYQIIFIIKNREGSASAYQIVAEHDMSRNLIKEVGICNVPVDF